MSIEVQQQGYSHFSYWRPPPIAFGQLKGRGVDPGKIAINPMHHEDIERFIDVSINKV